MPLSANALRSLQSSMASVSGANELANLVGPLTGNSWFVDTFRGSASYDGRSWENPFLTMQAALNACATCDTIFFRGNVREECVASNLKFDVTIIGVGSLHHPDQPSSSYDPGSSCWRPPGTPTATTPLIEVRGRGWKFYNIFFDCPVDSSAIKLMTGTGDGLTEYDANHASIVGCDFRNGLYGVEDCGGCFNVTVKNCTFETLDATSSAAGIRYTTVINAPRRWQIIGNFFQGDSTTEGNERHIVSSLSGSLITGNYFGTVKGTGRYVDLNGGAGNIVCFNVMGGAYEASDYRPGTADLWYQNATVVTATTAPDGVSLSVPV